MNNNLIDNLLNFLYINGSLYLAKMQNPSTKCNNTGNTFIQRSSQRSKLHFQAHLLHLQVENDRIEFCIEHLNIPIILLLGNRAPLVTILHDYLLHYAYLIVAQ